MSPATVDSMTPAEVGEAYRYRLAYDRVVFSRSIYEAGRLAGFIAARPHWGKNFDKGPADIWAFSHEQKVKPPEATGEELEMLMEKLNR